jgi:hypothetical protein
VLVGNEDGVQFRRVFSDGGEAQQGLFLAEAGVDENASLLRPNEDGVAGARAG